MPASEEPNWVEHNFGFPRTPQSARDDITRGCRQLLSGKPYSLVSVQHLSGNGFVSDRLLSGKLYMVSSVKVHAIRNGDSSKRSGGISPYSVTKYHDDPEIEGGVDINRKAFLETRDEKMSP